MIEQYLGRKKTDDIFFSSMLSGLIPEKRACELIRDGHFQKSAFSLLDVIGKTIGLFGKGLGYAKDIALEVPHIISNTALGGAATGVLGAATYNILKERLTQDDPEAKFNEDIERLYVNKKREIENARWMSRIRAMRDELKRGYKKMTTDEYAKKYNSLVSALDERSE